MSKSGRSLIGFMGRCRAKVYRYYTAIASIPTGGCTSTVAAVQAELPVPDLYSRRDRGLEVFSYASE